MKRMILCAAVLLGFVSSATAQTKKKTTKSATHKATGAQKTAGASAGTVKLNSQNTSAAKTGISLARMDTASGSQRLVIADPVITTLNAKARGETTIPSLQIVGLPKHAFGFANGKLRLTPAGSTSSGGNTGLGGVATGNGMGAIGASPSMPGVNGKSPDAGSGMWGNARNLLIRTDSLRRH